LSSEIHSLKESHCWYCTGNLYRKFVPLQLQKSVLNLIAISVKPVMIVAISSHKTRYLSKHKPQLNIYKTACINLYATLINIPMHIFALPVHGIKVTEQQAYFRKCSNRQFKPLKKESKTFYCHKSHGITDSTA